MKTPFSLLALLLALLITPSVFSQQTRYSVPIKHQNTQKVSVPDYRWAKVDSLSSNGLPKSALSLITEIMNEASAKGDYPELIKANLYELKLRASFEENYLINYIAEKERLITEGEAFTKALSGEALQKQSAAKQIMLSILADLYWQYYSENRYVILQRTNLSDISSDKGEVIPISQWTPGLFIVKVSEYYKASLANPENLQSIRLNDFDTILTEAKGSKIFRPTLFDFLAHKAADFFMSEDASVTIPLDAWIMNDAALLGSAATFASISLTTADSLSFHFQATRVLQQLVKFHLQDKSPDALVDVDLKRLDFIQRNINHDGKDSLYFHALLDLESKYRKQQIAAAVIEKIALWYYNTNQNPPVRILKKQYRSAGEETENNPAKAREWCLLGLERYPKSPFAKNLQNLVNLIEQPYLEFQTQTEVIPAREFPVLLNYKNIDRVWFRVVPVGYIPKASQYNVRDFHKYLAIKPALEWVEKLPRYTDFRQHRLEMIFPKLASGNYLVMVNNKNTFTEKDTLLVYEFIVASNLALIVKSEPNGHGQLFILNRTTGKPVRGAGIQSFINTYNYQLREYERVNRDKYISGNDGSVNLKKYEAAQRNNNLSFEISYKSDTLIAENSYYPLYSQPSVNSTYSTFFFTDRAVYRPGQTIYFKGIVYNTNRDEHSSIAEGHNSTVILRDVNGQQLSSVNVTTNEFGSFNGSFVLPATGLTGQMSISNGIGDRYFNVEEYKRPRFEVKFVPTDSTFRLEEVVTVAGRARTYTDVAVNDATVKYRVVRTVIFPYRDFGYRIWPPVQIEDAEIAQGTVQTSEDGSFYISFTAKPASMQGNIYFSTYNYTIYADVTDVNGETRSGQTIIYISKKSLALTTDIPREVNMLQSQTFTVSAKNLYGRSVHSQVKAEIYKLKESALLLPRIWDNPDTTLYTSDQFKKRLPGYPYMDEYFYSEGSSATYKSGDIEEQVWSTVLNTASDSTFNLKNIKAGQGKYLLKLSTTDRFGELITFEREITLYSSDAKKVPYPQYLWFTMLNDRPKQGELLEFVVGSSVDARVLIHIQHKGKTLKQEWIETEGQKKLSYQLPDTLAGQVHLTVSMIHSNRLFQLNPIFFIDDTRKELKFVFETFRSVLTPGGTEKWKIKITDSKGNPVKSELLAAMYDASLDAIMKNEWQLQYETWWPHNINWNLENNFNISSSRFLPREPKDYQWHSTQYDALNWFGFYRYSDRNYPMAIGLMKRTTVVDNLALEEEEVAEGAVFMVADTNGNSLATGSQRTQNTESPVTVRRNLQETAFFYPHLTTGKEGETFIEFTVPEALTRWNFMGLAHNTSMQSGVFTKEVVTQKELMVVPNLPRFFREDDIITVKAKINNLLQNPIEGTAKLEIVDAITMKNIDQLFNNTAAVKPFTSEAKSGVSVEWDVKIPKDIEAVIVRITAQTGNHSDGEEYILQVLSNRILVTETLPLPVNGNETRQFELKRLSEIKPGSSEDSSIEPKSLTLEFTGNPIWYAIQALPWLDAHKRENADQVFNRFYANSLASYIVQSNPKVKYVFELWRNATPDALLSALEKNQELKSLFIEETPWLMEAKDESEQKRRIALMFDVNKIAAEKSETFGKLLNLQTANGGWPWFEGMPESRYITQLVVTGLGKLHQMGITDLNKDEAVRNMVQKAVNYLSARLLEDYQKIEERKALKTDNLGYEHIQFLYALSYFDGLIKYPQQAEKAVAYFSEQARQYWNSRTLYAQSMIAIQSSRNGDMKTARSIVSSLREKSITDKEMGMYWRANSGGYYWYEAPVETQAIQIELFDVYSRMVSDKAEKERLQKEIDLMKTWLLKQKQTQSWNTDRATVDAVYALIMKGTDWLDNAQSVNITVGAQKIETGNAQQKAEPGTGYFKKVWTGNEVTPDMANITVTNTGKSPAWGAVYLQYTEDIDKVTAANSPLTVKKQLYIKENQPTGPVLMAINPNKPIMIGDNIIVRIEISTDRDLEFVHLKDMRAAAFEPVGVLSGYKWQHGLWYFESIRDASTDFFINYLSKGSYVFEYPLMASQKGTFSNGITTIQCMYAPEFAAHSEGTEVTVKE